MEHSALGPHVSLCPAPELSVVVMCEHSMVHPLHKRSLSPLQWCSPRKVLVARKHVEEEILTSKCPRCRAAFLDFDGCCALQVRDSSIRLSTRNQKPKTRNQKPEIRNPKSSARTAPATSARGAGRTAGARTQRTGMWLPAGRSRPGRTSSSREAPRSFRRPRCDALKPETRNPKSQARNPKPETVNHKLRQAPSSTTVQLSELSLEQNLPKSLPWCTTCPCLVVSRGLAYPF